MRELIKSDIKRMLKDKLILIACIIGGAFAIITPLLYKAIFGLLEVEEMLGMLVDAKSQYFASFSPANNFGMIAPVFVAVIICKDFSYGTVRNKIVSGHSRRAIYLSVAVASATVLTALMMAHALLTLGFSLLFFDYAPGLSLLEDAGYFLLSTLLEILVCICISALVSFIAVTTRNIGLSILGFFAVNFVFLILGSITSVVVQLSGDDGSLVYGIISTLDKINIFTSTVIGYGTQYEWYDLLAASLPTVLGTAVLTLLGVKLFARRDLK